MVLAPWSRLFDMAIAAVGLVLVLPVLLLVALAVAFESPGGWLFGQVRLGTDGRPFRMYKIRTMLAGGDDGGHRTHMAALIGAQPVDAAVYGKWADDPRVTRIGRVLRRFSIDELPQLWNVLRGDMSIVGPRPPLPWEAELYDDEARRRLSGPPGLTGLWQVEGRGRLNFSDMLALDMFYLEHRCLWLDIKILARTPKAVFWSRYTA